LTISQNIALGPSSKFQPYIHCRDANQVQSGGCIPEVGFFRAEVSNPAGPKHETDDGKGDKGIKSQE
jgi:hypothetical protein